ncbi:MAG: hypothetical protein J6A61_00860 [Clostridia bacterium]|nr:hypothetical protein [Clostridia bacterium]
MNQIFHSFFHKNQRIIAMIAEFFSGLFMAIAAFHILPLSYEIAGLLIAVSGSLFGVLLFWVCQRFMNGSFWIVVCSVILLFYSCFPFPFDSYLGNGIYLGILAGVLLSVQVHMLSAESKNTTSQKSLEIWYIAGLLVGILLK